MRDDPIYYGGMLPEIEVTSERNKGGGGVWQTQTPQTIHHKSDDSLLTLQQKSQILSDFIDWKINHPYLYKTGQLLPFILFLLFTFIFLYLKLNEQTN